MIIEIKIPSPGESVNEVEISSWQVSDGDIVEKNQEIAIIESDKATLSLIAEDGGKIKIIIPSGTGVKVGSVACMIDTSLKKGPGIREEAENKTVIPSVVENQDRLPSVSSDEDIKITPLARKLAEESNIELASVKNSGKRIYKKDIESVIRNITLRGADRLKMSLLRRKLSQRLVAVKNETAMLTTFNEVDMSNVIALRKQFQEGFTSKHGMKLGYMSLFTKAVTLALKAFPSVNASVDNEDIIYYRYADIAVAVQTDKGLMTPVIRNAELKSINEIEAEIAVLAEKARTGKISVDDLTGGTFTISNGGIFGSLLSTPILNPPQSGILGMHNIIERPVAVNGNVEIRPMMYIALSYDHRIIDGRDSVGFLLKVKEFISDPEKMAGEYRQTLVEFLGLS